jgi:transposase
MNRKQADVGKEREWRGTIREAARSGLSIREFCRQRRVKERQFYWWRQKMQQEGARGRRRLGGEKERASFALVSDEAGLNDAGIELVLGDGRRLRIQKGVDEETLRAVLSAVGPAGC